VNKLLKIPVQIYVRKFLVGTRFSRMPLLDTKKSLFLIKFYAMKIFGGVEVQLHHS
jgi:hypothetical protein